MTKVNHNYVATNLMAELINDGLSLNDINEVCKSVQLMTAVLVDDQTVCAAEETVTTTTVTTETYEFDDQPYNLILHNSNEFNAYRARLASVLQKYFRRLSGDGAIAAVDRTGELMATGPLDKIEKLSKDMRAVGDDIFVEVKKSTSVAVHLSPMNCYLTMNDAHCF